VIKYQCSGWLKYKKGSSDLRGFTYTYDASGNITKIVTEGTNVPQAALTKEYTYDALGQLATEVNGSGTTFGYAYDTAGNIRNITKDGTVTKSFGYTNPSWPDLLTSVTSGSTTKDILYEGQTQTSGVPSSGNPVTYYNGKDYTFTWTKGRQLASATVDGKQVSYAYDMAGVRSSKQVGDTTYTYTTLSGKVMRQTWGDNNALEFVYDDGNQPFAMIYNDGSTSTLYYYVLNAQGDVIALLNANGKLAASYDYDAWGNCTVYDSSAKVLTDPTSIANLNPLRYRGYYYDAETGFYYLQSRYYDPAICRFINADTFATTDANGFLSANMFAYCENNPVGNSDSEGEFPIQVVAAAVSGVVNLATSWASAKATGQTFTFLDGAVAFVAGAVGVFGSAGRFASAAISGFWTAYSVSKNGGTTVGAISCGALSAGFSWLAFSNLAKFSSKRVDHILYKAATDASLGWGSNLIIAGATTAATAPRAPQKSKHKKNNVSEYRYAKEDHIRWKYYAEHFANRG
jgi:RHS repeat-associated protein